MANYLYNGVELPELPDVEEYPYKFAYYHNLNCSRYELLCGYNPIVIKRESQDGPYFFANGISYTVRDGAWVRTAQHSTATYTGDISSFRWANHDLLYDDDGTPYLDATCPINAETGEEYHGWCLHATEPTEPEPIDPQSYLMGFRLSQLLQGMRGKGEPVVPEPVLPESGVNPDTREITDTWEQIQQAIEESVYSTRYMLGDTKSFDMADGTAVVMQIVAFDADDKADGSKAAISWVSRDIIAQHSMNDTSTNANGWVACGMRTWLQGEFYENIPDEVKASIVPVNKTYYDNTTKTTLSCEDNVWIPSYRELFGDTSLEDSGAEYTGYFTENNSRIKYNASGSADSYFLRTARDSSSSNFRTIYVDGSSSYTGATNERGVVIGFCM